MLAFVNTKVTKAQLIASLEAHAAADRIRGGAYWSGERGCAVGCSIHDFQPGKESRHELYEPLFGVPRVLAYLEDSIFERLPKPQQQAWPLRFVHAIREGADLSGVWGQFALWLLLDPAEGVIQYAEEPQAKAAIERVGELYRRKMAGDAPTQEEWREAKAAAEASWSEAESEAEAAAGWAEWAEWATWSAATLSAARAAATLSAARAAATLSAARAAAAAGSAATIRQADKLIELIAAA